MKEIVGARFIPDVGHVLGQFNCAYGDTITIYTTSFWPHTAAA